MFALVGLVGCETMKPKPDEAALFRRKHPAEAKFYRVLGPAPLDFSEFALQLQEQEMWSLLEGVEKRKQDTEELVKYIETMRTHYSDHSFLTSVPKEIEATLDGGGGSLFFFQYRQGKFSDSGLIVLRDGNPVFRYPRLNSEK